MDMLRADTGTRQRRLRTLYGIAIALAVVTLAAPGVAAAARYSPAPGSSAGGWRVAARIQVAGHSVIVTTITAVSAEDAWLSGIAIDRKGTADQPLLERWNGSSWHRVLVPRRAARAFGQRSIPQLVAAPSAGGVWTFGVTGRYLHLRGRNWTTGDLPVPGHARLLVGHVAAFGSCALWAFGTLVKSRGGKSARYPYAARFDCRRWHAVPVPGTGALGQVSAISARNMLAVERPSVPALGPARTPAILHWNGADWRIEHPQPPVPGGGTITTIMASHQAGIWVAGSIPNSKHGTSELAMRWNGRAWTTDSPHPAPSAQDFTIAGMAPDGQGGVWAISDSVFGTGRFWHFTHGTWSHPVHSPWLIIGLAPVPGTNAILAISESNTNTAGLVILHGSLKSQKQKSARRLNAPEILVSARSAYVLEAEAVRDFMLVTGGPPLLSHQHHRHLHSGLRLARESRRGVTAAGTGASSSVIMNQVVITGNCPRSGRVRSSVITTSTMITEDCPGAAGHVPPPAGFPAWGRPRDFRAAALAGPQHREAPPQPLVGPMPRSSPKCWENLF